MGKYLKFAICIYIFNISCTKKILVKEGLLSQYRYFSNISDSSKLPMADHTESKIWFMDSCVIYEMKVLRNLTNNTDSGVFKFQSYDLYKFTYLDLRNLTCQDYYHFSDTALPVANYRLKPEETLNWNFYAKGRETDLAGDKLTMTDTVIQNKDFKRLRFQRSANGYTDESIYCIDCNAKQNIFHINRSIDEMFPDCKVVRLETRGDIKDSLKWIFEANVVREILTPAERSIFSKWGKNASETKLPLINLGEVMARYGPSNSPIEPSIKLK